MSQTESSTSLRKFPAFWLLALWLLSGCGFHPVYAKTEQNDDIIDKLAQIRVDPVSNHDLGERHDQQILQTNLVKLFNPAGGTAGNPAYELKVTLSLAERDLGIRGDLRVTRYDVIGTANYQLIEIATNRELDNGSVNTKSSYNRTESEFSTFVSEQDSNELASRELAQLIKERMIYYFSK